MKIHHLDPAETLRSLKTPPEGLSEQEASRRLTESRLAAAVAHRGQGAAGGRAAFNREAGELVPGDVVVPQEGDSIPAECRLLEAFSIRNLDFGALDSA